jgi:ribosomal protein L28
MSKVCQLCEKKSQKGKKIALIWGVKYRSIRHRQPNLRKTTILVQDVPVQVNICTDCLKSVKQGKIFGAKYPEYVSAEAAKAQAK